MNKQQIEEAAGEYASKAHQIGTMNWARRRHNFINGVEWVLSQPKDVDEIRKEFVSTPTIDFMKDYNCIDIDAIWSFFLPYLQPQQSDAVVKTINKMCEESLSPIVFEMWKKVEEELYNNRKDLK